LVLNEEFSGPELNKALWTPGWHRVGISGLSERCVSSSLVSQPGDGYLHLQIQKHENECEWAPGKKVIDKETGSLVESNPGDGGPGQPGFAYSYGVVEWRAYIPGKESKACAGGWCIGNWPALWSLPEAHTDEIDAMEGLEQGPACFHFHPPYPGNGVCLSGNYVGCPTFASSGPPAGVTYYYDGKAVGSLQSQGNNPSPQYLAMDVAHSYATAPKMPNDPVLIDYVRVWQHPVANEQFVYWKGTAGQLWEDFYSLGSWGVLPLGASIGTELTGDANSAGEQFVYWKGADGQLWEDFYGGGRWHVLGPCSPARAEVPAALAA